MRNKLSERIPERGFGQCRWCGEERVRLQYLMCPKCFHIANKIPSKVSVLINQPEFRAKHGKQGVTIEELAPELYDYLLAEEDYFLTEDSDRDHWQAIKEESMSAVQEEEIQKAVDALLQSDAFDIPTREELIQRLGIQKTLQFFSTVAVLRQQLRLQFGDQDMAFLDQVLDSCSENMIEEFAPSPGQQSAAKENAPEKPAPPTSGKTKPGMRAKEIIQKLHHR
jgi:hypothetical protein